MKRIFLLAVCMLFLRLAASAQGIKDKEVPEQVKASFQTKFPGTSKVSWEKEKGNYEANWGGRSGEDHSAMFTPAGTFIELVDAIPVDALPTYVATYVREHYKGAKILEAGKLTDAAGKKMFEAEIRGKDLIFDDQGRFLKED
jgi:hypothetical protein